MDKIAAKAVEVQERTNGRIYIFAGNTRLHYKELRVKILKYHIRGEFIERNLQSVAI